MEYQSRKPDKVSDFLKWINVTHAYEVKRWARNLCVSETRIREAVAMVGVNVAGVKKYLQK